MARLTGPVHHPAVTVAIPTRNRREWLRECLDSVLGQAFTDLEVYISDNASTDGTEELVASYNDPRINYRPLRENIGLWRNLTRCLRLGTAPYVSVLPDDDLMLAGNLEPQVRFLNEHPSVGLVHSAFDLIDREGKTLQKDVHWLQSPVEEIEPGPVYIDRMLASRNRTCLPTVVMRRGAVKDLVFDERDGAPADAGLFLRVALRWEVGYIDQPLAACRVHPKARTIELAGSRVEEGEYRPTLEAIGEMERTKERFLQEHGGELKRSVPVSPRRWNRRATVAIVADTVVREGKTAIGWRLLAGAVRRDPLMLPMPRFLSLVAAMAGGARGVRAYRGAVQRLKNVRRK